jgi:hypothetical protein
MIAVTLVLLCPLVSLISEVNGCIIGDIFLKMIPFRRMSFHNRSEHKRFFLNLFFGENTVKKKRKNELGIVNPDAAGIDVGSEVHYVCVPEGRAEPRIQKFACFTEDLHNLAKWLKDCGIKTVAMESTGVYWIPLFQVLETQGFDVKLVNAKHVKNVPGRKTDVQDCQWLQQLHSYGLLQGSFRPEDIICVLRSYIRQRDNLIKSAAMHIQRMQKALIQMNMQLHKVLSDITTATGLRIIKAILAGERNAEKLGSLRDHRTKNDLLTIAKALKGDWREEHLFSLKQEFELYEIYQTKIAECDKQIAAYYQQFETKSDNTKDVTIIKKNSRRIIRSFIYVRNYIGYAEWILRKSQALMC